MPDGLRMYEVLYGVWGAIQGYHPEVPDVMLYVTGRNDCLASTATNRWSNGQDEVFISGARLNDGEDTLASFIHEAAHVVLSTVPEARSTPSGVHTWQFREQASKFGMDKFLPVDYKKQYGFALSYLRGDTIIRYRAEIQAIESLGIKRYSGE